MAEAVPHNDVELHFEGGRKRVLIDGVRVRHVQSVTVGGLEVHSVHPEVTITFRPGRVVIVGQSPRMGRDDPNGRGKYDEATGLYEWYEDPARPWSHVVVVGHPRISHENGRTTEHPVLAVHLESNCPTDCPYRKQ